MSSPTFHISLVRGDSPSSPPTSPRPSRFQIHSPRSFASSSSSVSSSSLVPTLSKDVLFPDEDLPYLVRHPITLEKVRSMISRGDLRGESSLFTEKVQVVGSSVFSSLPIGIKPSTSPRIDRGVSAGEMYLKLLYMHLAYDCYAVFGNEMMIVPKSRLFLEHHNYNGEISTTSSVAGRVSIDPYGIESLKLEFNPIDGFQAFQEAKTKDKNGDLFSFIDFIRTFHRLPDTLITPTGVSVPLRGAVGFLAIARALADIAPIGDEGKNAGFVWVIDAEGKFIAAQTVLAAQALQTAQTALIHSNRFFHFRVGTNWAYDSRDKGERAFVRPHHLKNHGIKDLQICANDALKISWNNLSMKQKEEFVQVLIHINRFFKSPEIPNFLFEREGAFYPSEMAESLKDQVVQLKGRIANWLGVQMEIYQEELSELRVKYALTIKTVRKIDEIGELSPGKTEKLIEIIRRSILYKKELTERNREIVELKIALEQNQHFLDEEKQKFQAAQDELLAERQAHQALRESWVELEKQKDLTGAIKEINGTLTKSSGSKSSIFRRSSRKFSQEPLKDE